MNRGLIFAMLASLMFSFMNVLVKEASRSAREKLFLSAVLSASL